MNIILLQSSMNQIQIKNIVLCRLTNAQNLYVSLNGRLMNRTILFQMNCWLWEISAKSKLFDIMCPVLKITTHIWQEMVNWKKNRRNKYEQIQRNYIQYMKIEYQALSWSQDFFFCPLYILKFSMSSFSTIFYNKLSIEDKEIEQRIVFNYVYLA